MLFVCITILLLYLSFLYDFNGYTKNKANWYIIAFVVLFLFAGLKYHLGGDNYAYLYKFYNKEYPVLSEYTWEDFELGKEPLFGLINSFVFALGGKFYVVQLIHSFILNSLIFLYIKKHSKYVFTCLFFYFITSFFHYNTEILRGSLSIVICLYGHDFIIEKKWLKGYLLYTIALFFHQQTILVFFLPALMFLKIDRLGYVLLGLVFLVSFQLQRMLGDYLFMLELFSGDSLGGELGDMEKRAGAYVDSDVYGSAGFDKISLGGWIVFMVRIIYVLLSIRYIKKHDASSNFSGICMLAYIGLIFTLVSFYIPIFYRYSDYFRIHFAILFSEYFMALSNNIKASKCFSYVRSFILFVPLFVVTSASILEKTNFIRYFPYTSIFDKQIVRERERMYNDGGIKPEQY